MTPDEQAWALAQLMAGYELADELDPAEFDDECAAAYHVYAGANGSGMRELKDHLAANERAALRHRVFAFKPGSPRPAPRPAEEEILALLQEHTNLPEGDSRKRADYTRKLFTLVARLDAVGRIGVRDQVCDTLTLKPSDFNRLLTDARKRDQSKKPSGKAILWESEPRVLHQSLDWIDGVAYTVVPLYMRSTKQVDTPDGSTKSETSNKLTPHVVTSRRDLVELTEALTLYNLVLGPNEDAFMESRWSKPGIRRFIQDKYHADPAAVLQSIVKVLEFYIEFQQTEQASGEPLPPSATAKMVALLIMQTYFMPAWPAIGYPLHVGEKESGKTKLQRIQAKLSFLGEQITAAITTAALKRMADQGYALYFDDIENVRDKSFDPDKRAIILAGNTRGVTIPLVEEVDGRKFIRRFRAFCQKGFTNIAGVDDVLGSRVLLVPMVRAFDKKRSNRDPEATPPPVAFQAITDDLYTLALTRMGDVERIYRELDPGPLADREFQIWAPVLTLAILCGGEELRAEMLALALAKRQEKADRYEEGLPPAIIRALVNLVITEGRTRITNDQILMAVAAIFPDLAEKETKEKGDEKIEVWPKWLVTKTGTILKNLKASQGKRHSREGAVYDFDPERVRRLAESFSIPLPAGQES